ncbi:4-hydroxy-tetrahydrodipicolinate synthase [Thermoactinomyces mirandus]|uniref:4-hydroxy-tetrahydrodipicolinate synthase n=1 Tax=Thermoactinomyces mirandus TaxID=2756294 RepID=A0A7W1XRS7_9BACL|nr:4-hydroxy-tetrahydrodipicolinate synthase [Thermoactinomyces mirandus]MBA4602103.1 4-hydroxy-tetrahydrodipicolinate synthase [Thermoactinomyces mirandus]
MMGFGRLITALYTPFTKEREIDWPRLGETIERLIENGNDAIVVSGTTAESPTLTQEEKIELFRFALEKVNGRIKVIAGTGSNNTAQSIQLTKKADEIGADGVMIVAPYYNKPSQEGLYQHFKSIAEVTKLPVMLYNVPGRTSVNMSVETMTRLAQLENVAAIKEASGNLNQISSLIAALPENVAVYSGDDGLTLPVLSVGGAGVVSVASHLVSREIKEMIDAYFAGDIKKARELHIRLLPVFHGVFITTSPAPLKYAMYKKGWSEPYVRLPIVELTEEEKKKTDEWIEKLL